MKKRRNSLYIIFLVIVLCLFSCLTNQKKNIKPTSPIASVLDSMFVNNLYLLFDKDSLVLNKVLPHLLYIQDTYILNITEEDAKKHGISLIYYNRVKNKIIEYNLKK